MRPSELYGIHDEVAAWSFDRAVAHFGLEIEADLDSVEHKNPKIMRAKREQKLQKWLTPEGEEVKGVFRDPARS